MANHVLSCVLLQLGQAWAKVQRLRSFFAAGFDDAAVCEQYVEDARLV